MSNAAQTKPATQRKKILYVSRAHFPSEVSHTLSIMRVCQAFTDAGHDVTLLGIAPIGASGDPVKFYGLRGDFRVELLPEKRSWSKGMLRKIPWRAFAIARRARQLIRELEPDLIYSRFTTTELRLLPSGIPILYEMHSLGPLGNPRREDGFKKLVTSKPFRRIIVTTNMLAKMLRDAFPSIDIVVARLSAEPPVEIAPAAQEKFREQNLQGKSFASHVGYTGFLDRESIRGTDIICKVAAEMPQTAFHVVGGEASIVDYWRDYAKDWNRHGNIFFYGHRNPAEIPYFLGCFDVVMAPLQFRPLPRAPLGQNMSPLKLPQYMAYRKATVASDLAAHREVLEDGVTALLVPADDISAWVAAIGKLLANPELRAAMGERAIKNYEAEYTPKRRVEKILEGL